MNDAWHIRPAPEGSEAFDAFLDVVVPEPHRHHRFHWLSAPRDPPRSDGTNVIGWLADDGKWFVAITPGAGAAHVSPRGLALHGYCYLRPA